MSDAFGRTGDSPEEGPASPLGGVQRTSNLAMQQRSLALQEAAGNLLEKAYQRLHDHDEERAQAYRRRAAALPWDEHEEVHPAAMEVHLVLFNEVVSAMQGSGEGDRSWLVAAREATGRLDAGPAGELARALAAVDHDYPLSQPEQRMVKEIVGSRSTGTYDIAFGLSAASTADEVAATIEPMLHALVAYHRAFHHTD